MWSFQTFVRALHTDKYQAVGKDTVVKLSVVILASVGVRVRWNSSGLMQVPIKSESVTEAVSKDSRERGKHDTNVTRKSVGQNEERRCRWNESRRDA